MVGQSVGIVRASPVGVSAAWRRLVYYGGNLFHLCLSISVEVNFYRLTYSPHYASLESSIFKGVLKVTTAHRARLPN